MNAGWKFEVIHMTLQEEDNRLSVSMLCDIAGGFAFWILQMGKFCRYQGRKGTEGQGRF